MSWVAPDQGALEGRFAYAYTQEREARDPKQVLADHTGISVVLGLDATDELLLLSQEYLRCWAQHPKEPGSFELRDTLGAGIGSKARGGGRGH